MVAKPLRPKRSSRHDTVKRLEAPEQVAYVQWFRMQYPSYSEALMANMAGIKLTGTKAQRFAQMAKQKAMGFKAGVSDIQISIPNESYCGLWIEFKKPGSTIKDLSENQVKHLELMSSLGHLATWADTFEKAKAITQDYMLTAVIIP